ncbi:hypothetical protein, partial [Actinobacillus pleuropneumoniae]|uniref:hypothetical protein n=1 Tax=Actinobacillus pleuropneumoniae TaxID=715 RepID=UPI00227A6064
QKVDREWFAFLFMFGFRFETGLSPRAKEISSPETSCPGEIRSSRFVKLKARKQVKELVTRTPLAVQDTPQHSQKKKVKIKESAEEQSIGERVQRRVTRSLIAKEKGKTLVTNESPVSKGNLNDLL